MTDVVTQGHIDTLKASLARLDRKRARLQHALIRALLKDMAYCTCPGWCFFNPGDHHANCKCTAKEHGLANRFRRTATHD